MIKLYIRIERNKEGKITGLSFPGFKSKKVLKGEIRLTTVEQEVNAYPKKVTYEANGKQVEKTIWIAGKVKHLSDLEKTRLRSGQLVITPDGFGRISEFNPSAMMSADGLILPKTICVLPLKKNNAARYSHLSEVKFIDLIEDKSFTKYCAVESDYHILFYDGAPVEFTVTKKGKGIITKNSRKRLAFCKHFAKKQNGMQLFNELIKNGWNPLAKK